MIANDCDIFDKDVNMSKDNADDVIDQIASEKSHHDGIDEGEVAR